MVISIKCVRDRASRNNLRLVCNRKGSRLFTEMGHYNLVDYNNTIRCSHLTLQRADAELDKVAKDGLPPLPPIKPLSG